MKVLFAVAAIAAALRVAVAQATVLPGLSTVPLITPTADGSPSLNLLPSPSDVPPPSGWNDGTYSYLPNSAAQLTSVISSGGGTWYIPIATDVPASAASSTSSSKHHTLTIVLAVILPLLGAMVLVAILFHLRARRTKAKKAHAWVMRPGGWAEDRKEFEGNLDIEQASDVHTSPPSPPAPSHQRVRSVG